MEQNNKTFNISNKALVTVYSDLEEVPRNVLLPQQCHGDNLVEIFTGEENLEDCDVLITENKNISLGIKTADCAAICFTDGEKIGIAHIGWRGLCLSLIEKMLKNFNLENLCVFVGPFNHSFEIKKDFCFERIQKKFEDKYFIESKNKTTFLFKDAIISLLPQCIQIDDRNTFEDLSLPSFRRNKTSKRLVTVISFK